MAYPSTIDNFTNPLATDRQDLVSHADQHSNANNAIEAIEAVMGTTAGTSVLKDVLAGQFVATKSGTETLTNKTLTSPTINTPTISGGTLTNSVINAGTLTSPVINTSISGNAFHNDNSLTGASGSTIASDLSIKTYADNVVGSLSLSPTLLYNTNGASGQGTVTGIASSYGDVGGSLTGTVTTTGGTGALVLANILLSVAPNVGTYPQTTRLNLRVDSTDYPMTMNGQTGNINVQLGGSIYINGLTAGSHVFKVQVGYNSTDSVIVIGNNISGQRLQIIEFPT